MNRPEATTHGNLLPTWACGLGFLGCTVVLTAFAMGDVANRDVV